jgi:hypothetical protein
MSNERFTKHYIDIINSTLSDTVLRNITMQANAQYVDELIGGLNAENNSKNSEIEILKKIIEDLQAPPKRKKTSVLNKVIEPELTPNSIIDDDDGGTF